MSTRTEELAALYGEQYHEMPQDWREEIACSLLERQLWERLNVHRIREEMLALLMDIECGYNSGWDSVDGRCWASDWSGRPGPAYGLCNELTFEARAAEALRALVSAARRLLLHPDEIYCVHGVCGNLDLTAPNQWAYSMMHIMGEVWPNAVHCTGGGGYWADGCEWNALNMWVGKGGERRRAVLVDTIAVLEQYLKEQL